MLEVNKDNYHLFLTYHGLDIECAEKVVTFWEKTESYKTIKSVEQWVEASKFVLGINK